MQCRCNKCEETKPLECFYKNNRSKTGKPRQPCKVCSKAREEEKRREYAKVTKEVPKFKTCSVCNIKKPSRDFHKRGDTPSGLRSDCKECYNIKSKKYYEENSEEVIKRTGKYQTLHKEERAKTKRDKYQANPEKYRKKDKQWRDLNPDRISAYARTYRDKNPEKIRQNYNKYKEQNKDKIKEKRKVWYQANKDKSAFYSAKRRAIKKQATPSWADQNIIKSFYKEAQYFGESVDHIIPLVHDLVCGLHCEDNLQTMPLIDNIIKNNNFTPCEHEVPEFFEEVTTDEL